MMEKERTQGHEAKERLLAKLNHMVSNEKFHMDAYFMCGFPSKTPNENLLRACEAYLAADRDGADEQAAQTMLAALEAAAAAAAKPNLPNALASSAADIQQLLALKEFL